MHTKCEHGRRRSRCKECGGGSICEHGRQRSKCKECGGGGICEHGQQRSRCKECGGGSFCEYGKKRAAPEPSAAGPSQRPRGGSSAAGTSAAHAQAGVLDKAWEERSSKEVKGGKGKGKFKEKKKRAPPTIPYGTGTALGYEVMWTDRDGYAHVLQ